MFLVVLVVVVLMPVVVFAGNFQYYSLKGARLLEEKKSTDPFVSVFRFEVGYTYIKTDYVIENRFGVGLNHIRLPERFKLLRGIRKFVFFDLEGEVGLRNIEFFEYDTVQSEMVLNQADMMVTILRPTINVETNFMKLMLTDEFVLDGIKYMDANTVIGRVLLYPTKHIRSELVGSYTYMDRIERINRLKSEYYTGKFRVGWEFTNVKLLRRKLPGFELGAEMFLGEKYESEIWKTVSTGAVGPYLKTGFHLGNMFFWADVSYQPSIEMVDIDKSLGTEISRKDNRFDIRLGMYIFD